MKVTIQSNKLQKKLSKLDDTVSNLDKDLYKLASQTIIDIQERTYNSKDVNNRTFIPYTPSYRKRKRKAGYPSKPTLSWSNNMLNAMRKKVIKGGFEIYFGDAYEKKKAYYINYGIGKQPKRKFFGLSKKGSTTIVNKLKKIVGSVINE